MLFFTTSGQTVAGSNGSRRAFIRGIILLPSIAGLAAGLATADEAKARQTVVQYQPNPDGDRQCSKCRFFIAGPTADENGTCKVVEGSISPRGCCIAYNPK